MGKRQSHLAELKFPGIAPMFMRASTLQIWSAEIATLWRFTKNNGITVGIHQNEAQATPRLRV